MNRVCVIDMPGLSRRLLEFVPPSSDLARWLSTVPIAGLTPTFPALTCSVQASLTTGQPPSRHGIVANGVAAFRSPQDQQRVDASNFADFRRQVSFWEQSNQFLDAPRFWNGRFKTALLFFQNSMPGFSGPPAPAANIVLTPKPDHGPDGKLASLCWSDPADLVPRLFKEFGPFPLMNYWGPMAAIASSRWIAQAAAWVWRNSSPRLQWVYVPHLDYDLQRYGPDSPQAAAAVRDAADAIAPLLQEVTESGGKLMLLSEYAMRPVSAFVQPNRLLADAGLLTTRATPDGNLIDYAQSAVFAMVDHQIAHLYCRDAASAGQARSLFNRQPPLKVRTPAECGLSHRRCGDLVLEADPTAWFDYRWWNTEAAAPVFAKSVDIHRKPGYDPLELFWDPAIKGVSQDPARIRGSHGLVAPGEAVIAGENVGAADLLASDVAGLISRLLG